MAMAKLMAFNKDAGKRRKKGKHYVSNHYTIGMLFSPA